jgi:hypothetical protein
LFASRTTSAFLQGSLNWVNLSLGGDGFFHFRENTDYGPEFFLEEVDTHFFMGVHFVCTGSPKVFSNSM